MQKPDILERDREIEEKEGKKGEERREGEREIDRGKFEERSMIR